MNAFGFTVDQTQRLKAWLVQKRWSLGDAPDAGFYALTEKDLEWAGLNLFTQLTLQNKLKEANGELL